MSHNKLTYQVKASNVPVCKNNDITYRQTSTSRLLNSIHRKAGNRAVGSLIQTKIKISQPNDPLEKEADKIAEKIIKVSDPNPMACQSRTDNCDVMSKGENNNIYREAVEMGEAIPEPAWAEPFANRIFRDPASGGFIDISTLEHYSEQEMNAYYRKASENKTVYKKVAEILQKKDELYDLYDEKVEEAKRTGSEIPNKLYEAVFSQTKGEKVVLEAFFQVLGYCYELGEGGAKKEGCLFEVKRDPNPFLRYPVWVHEQKHLNLCLQKKSEFEKKYSSEIEINTQLENYFKTLRVIVREEKLAYCISVDQIEHEMRSYDTGLYGVNPGTPAPKEQPITVNPKYTEPQIRDNTPEQYSLFDSQTYAGQGEKMPPALRSFFEPRFGSTLENVRLHISSTDAVNTQALNARAYTIGNHIVFGKGEYSPNTHSGKLLLAHELVHVLQQEASPNAGVIQRAEVDDRSCVGLNDIEDDVDSKVNSEIAVARTATPPSSWPPSIILFLREVSDRLGKGIISPIEKYILGLPELKRTLPSNELAGTKYHGAGVANPIYKAQSREITIVTAAMKIRGICVGADKLGHFFAEGYAYFEIQSPFWRTEADAKSTGRALEIGFQGLSVTGVYSNADQAANRAGMQFYKDLAADPDMKFSIKNYITPLWSEKFNPSFYQAGVGSIVWSNLLTGAWRGLFTSEANATSVGTKLMLSATTHSVTGSYEKPEGGSKTIKGMIKNGVIRPKTTNISGNFPGEESESATPVIGISVEFDWEEGELAGKGKWDSVDEQTLIGTWGVGLSRTDGGTWKMMKV